MKRALVILIVILLQGCAGAMHWEDGPGPRSSSAGAERGTHVVREGDTLFSIAWRNDLDYRDLAAWNDIEDPSRIRVGQRLSLRPAPGDASPSRESQPDRSPAPAERPSRQRPPVQTDSELSWAWPVRGELIGRFGQNGNRGIDISSREGAPIHSAAAGEVVYSGSGLSGYGQLIIVKHTDTYLSAYAHNRRLLVEEGDRVSSGQRIAEMGRAPGSDERPQLHFEIRRNGEPVDPLTRLPER